MCNVMAPLHLTSPANPRLKSIAKLADKKHRTESGLFWLEGEAHVQAALAAGWVADCLLVADDGTVSITPPFQHSNILTVPRTVLSRITGRENPQPVLGVFRQRWAALPAAPKGLVVVLDRIRDPGNLGTIIRTADACGSEAVVLAGDCTDPFAPECVRATVGSLVHVPLIRAGEVEVAAWAQGLAVPRFGTRMDGAQDVRQLAATPAAVLMMGNESAGLSATLGAACTSHVALPMRGHTESLNVATAAAVVMYRLAFGG